MDSSVSLKDQIWFLRVCHHVSNVLYGIGDTWMQWVTDMTDRYWHGDMILIWQSVTTRRKSSPSDTLYTKRPTWTRLALNLGVCDKCLTPGAATRFLNETISTQNKYIKHVIRYRFIFSPHFATLGPSSLYTFWNTSPEDWQKWPKHVA